MKYYKVLNEGGQPANGGSGKYHLPTKRKDGTWKPGEWMPAIEGDLIPCKNGYHLCRPQDLVHWLGQEIYQAEYKGERVDKKNKIVVRQVRLLRRVETWDEKTARLFACWCARQVWRLLTNEGKNAVIVAEKYANGEATIDELNAACDAAWDAAWAAGQAAAWDAGQAAASDAARAAAWDAAWNAGQAAARAAAWDAAWNAARDAARAAAWAAGQAAARDVAWDAGQAAASDAQTKQLFGMLGE